MSIHDPASGRWRWAGFFREESGEEDCPQPPAHEDRRESARTRIEAIEARRALDAELRDWTEELPDGE